MFYSNQILARKGPLGLVWIAAHMDGRLKRQQINSASIPASVDTLLDPEVPLALRLSGQLLLGVVRIYARKVAYLQQDCDAALIKIRVALRPADNCNLPPDSQVAPVEAITMLGPAAAAAVGERARKARAAKAAADGKNNAAAAAVDGWMGPVDEEGLMLGLDDIAWDQEGFLGDAGEPGFGMGFRFEPNSRLSLGLAPSKSGLGSQDISGVFGMYSSQDEMQETFDVEDEAAAAVWDLDDIEVERLRAAPSQSLGGSQGGLSELLGGDTPAGGVKSTGKTAHAGAFADTPSEGGPLGHEGFTPGSMPDMQQAAAAGSEGADDMDLDLNPEDALPTTPHAPTPPAGVQEGADEHAEEQQQDPYDIDDFGNLADMLPPTPAADEDLADAPAGAAAAAAARAEAGTAEMHAGDLGEGEGTQGDAQAAAAAAATKTFQRRSTRQQAKEQEEGAAAAAGQQGAEGQEAAAAAADGDAEAEAKAKAAAAKSARRRRVSGLLGHKRRVVLDAGGGDATGGGGGGVRHAPTELPAAEIRALLADRAPLMDMERVAKVSRHLQQQAAASSLTAQGAAAAALAQQQQQQLLLAASTAAGAAAGPAAAAAAGPSSPCAAAAEVAVAPASLAGVVGARAWGFGPLGSSMAHAGLPCSATLAGGLGLPFELQQLFKTAAGGGTAAAAAATRPPADAAAAKPGMAPTAPLEDIGGYGDEVEDGEGFAGAAAALNPALATGATRCSLSLSLTRTPGSAGAAAGASHPTPGTDAATAAGPAAAGQFSGYTPGFNDLGGSAGFTPGEAGYTPGYEPAHKTGDVLQPLDDVNLDQDDVNLGQDDVMHGEGPEWDADDEEHRAQKENTPLGTAGKGAAAAAVAGGSSVRVPWPADAETLLEQEVADQQVPDGSFTARTRLVVRHLQHAAATAAASGAGGYASAATAAGLTPSIGSKRRISAAAAAGLAGPAAGKDGVGAAEGGGAAAAGLGPVLSFEGISAGHNRLDACRWFYEMLVLSNKGLVTLRQDESYGNISVTPNLASMARV